MRGNTQALCVVLTIALAPVLALVLTSPGAAAPSSATWTTDADFNAPGAVFTATEVVGTGVPASVQLLRDFVDWVNLNPASPPSPRESPGFAFAGSSNLAFLFGGYDGFDLEDTWQYDYAANAWTRLTPSPHPPGREVPAFSYDPVQNVVVLFGGLNTTWPDVYLTDTWEFNVASKTWSQVSPPIHPGLMLDSRLVYDASASRHILVGGNATTGAVETWAYDAAANTWTFRTSGTPAARTGFALAYHAQRQRTVLFAGFEPLPFPGTPKGDTWEYRYSTNAWSMTVPDGGGPSARSSAALTYRSSSQSVLLFGGGSPPKADTWRYTASAQWESVGALSSPPGRNHAGLVYHVAEDVALLFGGRDGGGAPLDDSWKLGPAYRAAGRYASPVLDSGGANVQWQWLFWNRTVQPGSTYLRFQIATSTDPNSDSWNYSGPDGTPFTYYTTSGVAIHPGRSNHQYLRFLADYGSFDSQATPVMEDVTIAYDVPPAPPTILLTDPAMAAVGVPVDKVVRIQFSEAMDPDSVSWQFLRGTPVPLTKVWSAGNTIVDLTHSGFPFAEGQLYEILVNGTDVDRNGLVPGPVPNPFLFAIAAQRPYIADTDPLQGQIDVFPTAPIVVRFNERMNTGSLQYSISPFLAGLSLSWNTPTNDTVTFPHSTPFTECIRYTIEISYAEDLAGFSLMPGPKPNPWTFTSCRYPYPISTSPRYLQDQVSFDAPVIVNFSTTMSRANTTLTISPDVGGQSFQWSNADRTLTMTHTSPFPGCTAYTATAEGTDTKGHPLTGAVPEAVPNPFTFMTACANPYIIATRPADRDDNVSLDTSIIIAFGGGIDQASVGIQVTPSIVIRQTIWHPGAIPAMEVFHTGFQECTNYTVEITGRGPRGAPLVPGIAPNPWSFSTICVSPYITSTDPADADTLVPLSKAIVVTFSEPMDPPMVVAKPTPSITLSRSWSNNNQTLTLTHTADFQNCTQYTMFVDGLGADGRSLIIPGPNVPDPWSFRTFCITSFPYIVRTDPANNEQNVPNTRPVTVEFSEPMDPVSLQAVFGPSVAGVVPTWSDGDKIVTLNHNAFEGCTVYTVTISAHDLDGNALGDVTGSKQNPWAFQTACSVPLPGPPGVQVVRLPPDDILLTWGAVPDAAGYTVYSSTDPFAAWPWPVRAEATTTSFRALGDLVEPTPRYYIVRAKDSTGTPGMNSTMGAKVPLAFTFATGRSNVYWISLPYRTAYERASDISNELTATRIDVVAKWDPVRQTSILWYLFRGQWRGTNFVVDPGDALWIGVRSTFTWVVNGTDGTVPRSFTLNDPPLGNLNWISLPYTSTYAKASDLVLDLEGSLGPGANTKIVEVGKWDGASQSLFRYYWTTTGWTGSDFTIASGEGVYFRIVASFAWTPRLITPEVP